MPVERAARQMQRAIERGRRLFVLPWQMLLLSLLLRVVPAGIYARFWPQDLASKARRTD